MSSNEAKTLDTQETKKTLPVVLDESTTTPSTTKAEVEGPDLSVNEQASAGSERALSVNERVSSVNERVSSVNEQVSTVNEKTPSSAPTAAKSDSSTPNVVNVVYTGNTQTASLPQYQIAQNVQSPGSKYNQLIALIEELGKEIRPTYTGNRNSTEKLKRAIAHGRILARECILEVEKNARQQQYQQQQQQNS